MLIGNLRNRREEPSHLPRQHNHLESVPNRKTTDLISSGTRLVIEELFSWLKREIMCQLKHKLQELFLGSPSPFHVIFI
jgi:hypothetical protein